MIRSFRNKGLARFAAAGDPRRLSVRQGADRIRRILTFLDAAERPEDMNLPGFYFHGLHGESRFSVRVTGNWRITFGWDGVDAVDVDLEDYH